MRDDMEKTKKCACCGRILPVSEFSRSAKSNNGLQSWCKSCEREYHKDYNRPKHPGSKLRIDLEPYKKEILIYRRTHTIKQTASWITKHCGIKCGETTVRRWLSMWNATIDTIPAAKIAPVPAPAPQPEAATLTDFNDADIIQELRKRGYRVFSERYIKKWGNHYKKQLIEITQ